ADSIDVLLIISPWRNDIFRPSSKHLGDGVRHRLHYRRIAFGQRRADLPELAKLVAEARPARLDPLQRLDQLLLYLSPGLLDQIAAVDHDPGTVGHDRRRKAGVALLRLLLTA